MTDEEAVRLVKTWPPQNGKMPWEVPWEEWPRIWDRLSMYTGFLIAGDDPHTAMEKARQVL